MERLKEVSVVQNIQGVITPLYIQGQSALYREYKMVHVYKLGYKDARSCRAREKLLRNNGPKA